MRQGLTLLCLFAIAAGIWLAAMENILKHYGYAGRSAIAICIVMQAVATLLFLRFRGPATFRGVIFAGALALLVLGISAIVRILQTPHFEGFVLIIGGALTVQGGLTLALLLRPLKGSPVSPDIRTPLSDLE